MEKRRYDFGQQCMAFILLVTSFLQSCNNESINPEQKVSTNKIQDMNNNSSTISNPNENEEKGSFFFDANDFENEKVNIIMGDIIGEGSCGKVFECRISNRSGSYALKEVKFSHDNQQNEQRITRIKRELDTLKEIRHKHIVRLIGYHIPQEKDRLVIIMNKYNTSLKDHLDQQVKNNTWWNQDKERLLSPADTRKVARHILKGLSYLHGKKIAHRDIKPANALVNTIDGKIKSIHLADFDTSKYIDGTTTLHTVTGTPSYMAPELYTALLKGTRMSDYEAFKADVYSFGRTLYKCVTGKEPVQDENMNVDMHDEDEEYGVTVDMFRNSTQQEPEKRPSCKELVKALQGSEAVLFFGNPGKGKSALCNSIFSKAVFKSEYSSVKGVTQNMQEHEYKKKVYIDTPGLSDITRIKKAAKQIRKALLMYKNYKFVFVINSKLTAEDLATLKAFNNAIAVPFKYGVIINKVSNHAKEKIKRDNDVEKEFKPHLRSCAAGVSEFLIIKQDSKMEDKDNIFLTDPEEKRNLIDFITTLNTNELSHEVIKDFVITDYQEQLENLKEKLRKAEESIRKAEEDKGGLERMLGVIAIVGIGVVASAFGILRNKMS